MHEDTALANFFRAVAERDHSGRMLVEPTLVERF
jgi:hypothetical protein